jgi:serine/threonine protein kinase
MGSSELTTKTAAAGTYRYMAPELFDDEITKTTKATDVWAFAMTAIEVCIIASIAFSVFGKLKQSNLQIFTGSMPFSNIINDANVVFSVMSGGRPKRELCLQINEGIWAMLEKCWYAVPERRPEMDTVYHFLVASMRGGH